MYVDLSGKSVLHIKILSWLSMLFFFFFGVSFSLPEKHRSTGLAFFLAFPRNSYVRKTSLSYFGGWFASLAASVALLLKLIIQWDSCELPS
ncbi:hypothetical protein K2173_003176 [Erythroxylum novogranatense]|uniref:Uncharacterized protein n=1 Tax=Erythroxylum novogranatense TaxID=1862640 RepID=A0AAV8TBM4_9ROSI|nr:hypothetical protein K2173_003176 [Erythroxylum novogranatense]